MQYKTRDASFQRAFISHLRWIKGRRIYKYNNARITALIAGWNDYGPRLEALETSLGPGHWERSAIGESSNRSLDLYRPTRSQLFVNLISEVLRTCSRRANLVNRSFPGDKEPQVHGVRRSMWAYDKHLQANFQIPPIPRLARHSGTFWLRGHWAHHCHPAPCHLWKRIDPAKTAPLTPAKP